MEGHTEPLHYTRILELPVPELTWRGSQVTAGWFSCKLYWLTMNDIIVQELTVQHVCVYSNPLWIMITPHNTTLDVWSDHFLYQYTDNNLSIATPYQHPSYNPATSHQHSGNTPLTPQQLPNNTPLTSSNISATSPQHPINSPSKSQLHSNTQHHLTNPLQHPINTPSTHQQHHINIPATHQQHPSNTLVLRQPTSTTHIFFRKNVNI